MREIISFFSDFNTLILATGIMGMVIWAVYAYIQDKNHPTSALRRSFPLLARGRYFLEHAGVFLRQYMFAGDRTELPFNREQRRWVYRASDNEKRTVPFGSTHDLSDPNSFNFLPSLYPTLDEDSVQPTTLVIGEHTPNPYKTNHIFHISGMSFGSLSAPAVQALGIGAKESGCWMNTGEGGISPYHIESGADLVVQIGTAHYSMRNEDGTLDFDKLKSIAQIESVKMFELKLSQGAKPGKGGILPAKKITKEIAEIRGIPVGVDSISPNRHMEAPNDEGLLELIAKIRNVTNKPCGIKMCLGNIEEFETLVSKIDVKNGPDFITIDGGEGGTGASPASLIDYVGMPLFKALPLVHDVLKQAKLRDSIEIIASGKLITPEKVAGALAYGADFVVSARGFMMSLGCIQALHCNDNTCPTGITTQDEDLQKNLIVPYRAERVKNYINNMEYEVGVIAHSCGCKYPRDLNLGHIL